MSLSPLYVCPSVCMSLPCVYSTVCRSLRVYVRVVCMYPLCVCSFVWLFPHVYVSPPCVCPSLHMHVPSVHVPSVCMSLHVYVPSAYVSRLPRMYIPSVCMPPPSVCPLRVYISSYGCSFIHMFPPCVCPLCVCFFVWWFLHAYVPSVSMFLCQCPTG